MSSQINKAMLLMHAMVEPIPCWRISKYVYGRKGLSQRMNSRLYSLRLNGIATRMGVTAMGYCLTPEGHERTSLLRRSFSRQRTLFEQGSEFATPETEEWFADLITSKSDNDLLEIADWLELSGDPRCDQIRDWMKQIRKILDEKELVGQSKTSSAP